ncbi:heme biosynthesis HemY N-terminal domain-containing protein [Marinobacterium sediminicola]|uniref:HemY protein n=1 Tax=Marinobacterium sediminicola TaxID=518898 RepID=A0ABY1RZA1_9GAMM|nr:heme biosynthesis HemY N-terminal domain-containing protein [Marinobacterium sediminicola]ULG69072.1 heme biosynthesis protein HemY [Marinobacterium sediminicola]SMR73651.1 HemY protein [Marinobacterium sediminicola]
MKKLFIFLLLFLVVGAWLGQMMVQDPGYVLLAYKQTTIETSLWVLLLLLIIGFALGHWLLNLISGIRVPGARVRDWQSRRNQRISQRKSLKGMVALSEGNWWKAQRYLSQAAERSDLPAINYLAAARAAHEQGDSSGTDALLNKARSATPQAEVAIGLTQAQFQLERGQLEPCLANLLNLRRQAPKNTQVLRLLQQVYLRLEDWLALIQLMPELKRQGVLNDTQLAELEQQCHLQRLEQSLTTLPTEADDQEKLRTLSRSWQAVPQHLLRDPALIGRYTDLMRQIGAEAEAEEVLLDLIKRKWDIGLVEAYGTLAGKDPQKQLNIAKGWQKKHPDCAELELTLGRLSMRNELWGQAISHFERSFELDPRVETFSELQRLLQHLGETERAAQLMQANFGRVAPQLPALPLPQGSGN